MSIFLIVEHNSVMAPKLKANYKARFFVYIRTCLSERDKECLFYHANGEIHKT